LLTFFEIRTIYFCKLFIKLKKAKQKSRYTDIKKRRELCSRFKMMFYVTALKFKDGTVVALIHSRTVPKRIEWWVTVFFLSIPPALGGFATSQSYIVFSCNPSFKRDYIISENPPKIKIFPAGFEYFSDLWGILINYKFQKCLRAVYSSRCRSSFGC